MKSWFLLPICVLAAVLPLHVLAQTEQPLVDEMLSVYKERCANEVKELARKLDGLNQQTLDKLPQQPLQSVLPSVREAWKLAPTAIPAFLLLRNSPRKFTAWAAEEHMPRWFSVPDSVAQVSRWEGLRPILAPLADGDHLAWDSEDTPEWKRQPGAWRFELLLLLRWFGGGLPRLDPAVESRAMTWAAEQTGNTYIDVWRQTTSDRYEFLHAAYTYTLLKRPIKSGKLPHRLSQMADHLSWAGGTDLSGFLQEKDALLADVLEDLIGEQSSNKPEIAWFDVAARSFPPLTAFEPRWTAAKNALVATDARRDSTLSRELAELRRKGASSDSRHLLDDVLWYQGQFTPDGKMHPATAGWSSWVPSADAPQSVPLPAQLNSEDRVGSQSVWREMCLWMAKRLAQQAGRRPIRFRVRHPLTWVFAFREGELQELAEELNIPLVFGDSKSSMAPVNVTLEITDVDPPATPADPGGTINVELWIDGVRDSTRSFQINPWTPLIVSRTMELNVWMAVAVIAWIAAWYWLLRSWIRLRERPLLLRWQIVAALNYGLLVTVFMIANGPRPAPAPELGGTIEFALPLHGGTPPPLSTAVRTICLTVYRRLAALSSVERMPRDATTFRERFSIIFQGLLGSRRVPHFDPKKVDVADLRYSIVASRWPAEAPIQGRIDNSRFMEFDELLRNPKLYQGEPDLPLSLLTGPKPGTRMVLNLSDGDHGAIRLRALPVWNVEEGTIVSVFLPAPSRDSRSQHGLGEGSRYQWTKARSTVTRCLLSACPDHLKAALAGPARDEDLFAETPSDLIEARQESWQIATQDASRVQLAADEIGEEVIQQFHRPQTPGNVGSHSILELPATRWRTFLLLLPLGIALPVWLMPPELFLVRERFLVQRRSLYFFAAWLTLLVLGPILGVSAVVALLSPWVSTFGASLLDAVQLPVRCVAAAVLLVAIGKLASGVVEWRYPNEFTERIRPLKTNSKFSGFDILGCILAGCALVIWNCVPFRDPDAGRWLPPDYADSIMAGWAFWSVAVFLIFCRKEGKTAFERSLR